MNSKGILKDSSSIKRNPIMQRVFPRFSRTRKSFLLLELQITHYSTKNSLKSRNDLFHFLELQILRSLKNNSLKIKKFLELRILCSLPKKSLNIKGKKKKLFFKVFRTSNPSFFNENFFRNKEMILFSFFRTSNTSFFIEKSHKKNQERVLFLQKLFSFVCRFWSLSLYSIYSPCLLAEASQR